MSRTSAWSSPDPDVDRGLMFLCYGATIEDQFEFLTRRWSNLPNQPNDGGHDPVIGQRDSRGDRERFIDVPTADGSTVRVTIERDWVVPDRRRLLLRPADLRLGLRADRTPSGAHADVGRRLLAVNGSGEAALAGDGWGFRLPVRRLAAAEHDRPPAAGAPLP